jgi:hypothetical protein
LDKQVSGFPMRRSAPAAEPRSMQIALAPPPLSRLPLQRLALSLAALALGFMAAAAIAGLGPLEGVRGGELDAGTRAMRALPFDAPIPDGDASYAGAGQEMPYLVEWDSPRSAATTVAEMSGVIASRPRWTITLEREVEGAHETTLTRATSDGLMTHFARLTVAAEGTGSRILFEFIGMTDLGRRR